MQTDAAVASSHLVKYNFFIDFSSKKVSRRNLIEFTDIDKIVEKQDFFTLEDRKIKLIQLEFPVPDALPTILSTIESNKQLFDHSEPAPYKFTAKLIEYEEKGKEHFLPCILEMHQAKKIYLIFNIKVKDGLTQEEITYQKKFIKGVGAYKMIYKAWELRSGLERVAYSICDIYTTTYLLSEQINHNEIVKNELKYLALFNGKPGLPSVYSICDYGNQFSIRMKEYEIDFLDLFALCEKEVEQIPDEQKLAWARQLLMSVEVMHKAKVMHRDIKPDNCVKNPGAEFNLTLIDFGLACELNDEALKKCVGSLSYVAPELLLHFIKQAGYGHLIPPEWLHLYQSPEGEIDIKPESEVWSIGCTLWRLWSQWRVNYAWDEELSKIKRYHSFENKARFILNSLKKMSEYNSSRIPEEHKAAQFLRRLLEMDPNKRLTIEQASQYFQELVEEQKKPEASSLLEQFGCKG